MEVHGAHLSPNDHVNTGYSLVCGVIYANHLRTKFKTAMNLQYKVIWNWVAARN